MNNMMIEKVARVISGAPFPSKASLRKARAAIEAMREPNEGMLEAGYSAQDWATQELCKTIWRAMIDHMLKSDQ